MVWIDVLETSAVVVRYVSWNKFQLLLRFDDKLLTAVLVLAAEYVYIVLLSYLFECI